MVLKTVARMKKMAAIAGGLTFGILFSSVYAAGVEIKLPQAEVETTFEEADFVGPLFTETNTQIKVTEKGINALGPASVMSVQKSISLMPSVNQQSVDPSGLSDISNYHESFRFRGVEPTSGGNPGTPVNMEGVPVTGRPGGGSSIYDMENFESVSIYKGGVPADEGFGLTDIGGKIDMEVKKPSEEFAFTAKQTVGSERFTRSYLRIDAGESCSGTSSFLSYSDTSADKWKGYGDSVRENGMLGVSQEMGDRLTVSAFGIYNSATISTYRPLSYEKASDLENNYDFDYTNDPADYFYYGYNQNDFEDENLLAVLDYQLTADSTLTVKPFYWQDEGAYMETVTLKDKSNRVRQWGVDHDMSGVLAQYAFKVSAADLKVGYFHLTQERPGPPTSWKLYKTTSEGLVFDKWQILSNSSSHTQNLPFVSGEVPLGAFTLEGGVKYLDYTMPSITTFNTTGIPDVSYDEAIDSTSSIEAAAGADAKDFNELLPNLGASYMITESLSGYLSYGRNYGLSVALYPYFIAQKSSFYQHGITLQDLWDKQELEIADNVDLGVRYITDTLYVVPTLYYAKHSNKAATYYDESLGVSFPTTSADASAYGFELEAGAVPMKNLSVYASFSYNRFYFTQDIYNQDGGAISVEGDQVPDAPEFLASGIVSYRIGKVTLSPIVKYTSARYGDILHQERIGDATIVDFSMSYATPLQSLCIRNMDLSLTVNNIFDREYVSIINTSDYQTLGSTYQAGAPVTVYGSVSITF